MLTYPATQLSIFKKKKEDKRHLMMHSLGGFTLGLLVLVTVSYPTKFTLLYHLWKKRNHVQWSDWVTWLRPKISILKSSPHICCFLYKLVTWHGDNDGAVSDKGVNVKLKITKATRGTKPAVKRKTHTISVNYHHDKHMKSGLMTWPPTTKGYSEYQGILESLWMIEPKSHQVFL